MKKGIKFKFRVPSVSLFYLRPVSVSCLRLLANQVPC